MALAEIQQTGLTSQQAFEERKPVIAPIGDRHAFTPEYQRYLRERIIAQNLAIFLGPIPKNEVVDTIPFIDQPVQNPPNKPGIIQTRIAPNVVPSDGRPQAPRRQKEKR